MRVGARHATTCPRDSVTAEEAVGSPATRKRDALVVGALALLSAGWFLVFHAWWLNSDGSTYLGTGRSALDGLGYRLPDGTTVAWWNRPVYPVLIALPSHFGGGIEASIWMSRIPLMLAAPVIAAAVLRLGRSVPAAFLAGLVAIAQPWTLLAGGSNLVPDGLTAVAMVAGVLAASIGIESASRRGRAGWWTAAVACLVLASLTKQTGIVGFLLAGLVLWNGLTRPPRRLVAAAVVLEGVIIFVATVVGNGPPEASTWQLPGSFVTHLRDEVFRGSPAVVVAGAITVLLVAWAVSRATEPLPFAGLALVAAGITLGMYASGNGLQQRNAAVLPYGVALLLGALMAERQGLSAPWWRTPRARVALGGLLVLSLVAGAGARAYSGGDVSRRNWDTAATRGVAAYLVAHRAQGSVGCTLGYCSFFWLTSDQRLDTTLLPQYAARPRGSSLEGLHFTRRTGFRGPVEATPPCTGTPLVVTKQDEGFGAVFECPLLRYVRDERPAYVVVSATGTYDTFDAGRLIPYLSSNPAFRLVYSTPLSDWPRVVAVYRVVGDPRAVPGAPTYYSAYAYRALPDDHGKPGVVELDGRCYEQAVRAALTSPLGGDATPDGCHAGG
jgi:hypothetical protein